jgi:hypothetical protein
LEKDNPPAPQMYVGPRKRRVPQRVASGSRASDADELSQAFQTLLEASEQFVNHTPRLKKTEAKRQALLDAITLAELTLSVYHPPSKRTAG